MRDTHNQTRLAFPLATVLLLMLVAVAPASAASGLWVEKPSEVVFSVGGLTPAARDLGLSDEGLAEALNAALASAGISARRANSSEDDRVLFLDVVVEHGTYYASLGFWRMASFSQPDGESVSDFAIVWQDFAVGSHDGDPDSVNGTLQKIIDRFVTSYREANSLADPLHAEISH